jgi:hypothetical protein
MDTFLFPPSAESDIDGPLALVAPTGPIFVPFRSPFVTVMFPPVEKTSVPAGVLPVVPPDLAEIPISRVGDGAPPPT